MSSAVIPSYWENNVSELFDHTRQLDRKPKAYQKFSKLRSGEQHRLTSLFRLYPITTIHVALHKPSIQGAAMAGKAEKEYAYLLKLTLERISWFCRDNSRVGDPNDGRCKLIFSIQNGLSYSELKNYMRWLKISKGVFNCSVEWPFVDTAAIGVEPHKNETGLHLADIAASALGVALRLWPKFPALRPQVLSALCGGPARRGRAL